MTAISGAMIGVGAVFVTAGIATAIGLMGLFATGITAIATVMATAGSTYLVYGDKMKDFLLSIPRTIDATMNAIGTKIKDAVMTIPNIVSGSISAAFKAIGDMLGNAIKGLIPGGSTAPAQNGSPWNHQLPDGEKHSSLVPSARASVVNLTANVNIDARKLASVVQSTLVADATFSSYAGNWVTG